MGNDRDSKLQNLEQALKKAANSGEIPTALAAKHDQLAKLYLESGNKKASQNHQDQASAIWHAEPAKDSEEYRGDLLTKEGYVVGGLLHYETALKELEREHRGINPLAARLHGKIGDAYLFLSKPKQAEAQLLNELHCLGEYARRQSLPDDKTKHLLMPKEQYHAISQLAKIAVDRAKQQPQLDPIDAINYLERVMDFDISKQMIDGKQNDLTVAKQAEQAKELGSLYWRHADFVSSEEKPEIYSKAFALLLDSMNKKEALGLANDLNTADEMILLADVRKANGFSTDTSAYYQRALEIQERVWGNTSTDLLPVLRKLAEEKDISAHERILAIDKNNDSPAEVISDDLLALGRVYEHHHNNEKANKAYSELLVFGEKADKSKMVTDALIGLTSVAKTEGNLKMAIEYRKRELAITERLAKIDAECREEVKSALQDLAVMQLEYEGPTEEAIGSLNKFIALEKQAGTKPSVFILGKLSDAYRQIGNLDQAIITNQQTLSVLEAGGEQPEYISAQHEKIANLLEENGQNEEAEKHREKAKEVAKRPRKKPFQPVNESKLLNSA